MAINIKKSHEGRLHEKLGVDKDKKIPVSKLKKAIASTSESTRKQAQFALNARKFKH